MEKVERSPFKERRKTREQGCIRINDVLKVSRMNIFFFFLAGGKAGKVRK